jgi:hypothetical protein
MAQDKYKISINTMVDDLPCDRCKRLEAELAELKAKND